MKTKKIFLLIFILFSFAAAKEMKSPSEDFIFKAELLGGVIGHGLGNFMIGDNVKGGLYLLSDLAFFDGGVAMIVVGSLLRFNKTDTATTLSLGAVVLIVGIVLRIFEVMDIRSYIEAQKRKNDKPVSFDERKKMDYYISSWKRKDDLMRLRWSF